MLSAEPNFFSRHWAGPIMSDFWHLCCEYGRFYQEGCYGFWRSLRPATYSVVLAVVWLIGFLLLKSGARR